MKTQVLNKFIIILFFSPIHLFGQTALPNSDISGLWKGLLYNDSTQKYLPYEIAISDEEGKLSGYSYTLFDIDGKKELGVKIIRIKRKDDRLFIEDIALIANTYSAPPPRKVRQQSVADLIVNDTAMLLTGKWSTNPTREYLPLTGSLQLQRALDFKPLVLFQKLVELKLEKDLSFVKRENKRQSDIASNKKVETELKSSVAVNSSIPDTAKFKAVIEKKRELVDEIEATGNEYTTSALTAEKLVVYKPSVNAVSAPAKKAGVSIATNEITKKENKSLAQLEKKPANDKFKSINSPVKDTITSDIANGHSTSIKINSIVDSVNKNSIKPERINDPVKAKANEAIVGINDGKKENNKSVINKPEKLIAPSEIRKTSPVAGMNPAANQEKSFLSPVIKKPVITDKPATIAASAVPNITAPVVVVKESAKTKPQIDAIAVKRPNFKKEVPFIVTAPADQAAAVYVLKRKTRQVQSVFFESDSLVLTLYDNGEIDGDTVSVLINGQIIFARQGLSTRANSKTIYFDKGIPDSLSMIMYAENLGSIPPNTGLLIITDGQKRYEVRFSADLSTNAAIIFRRKTTLK